MVDITLVAAMDENRVIGVDGDLPWHYPEDLAHFKETTEGHPVIMGRVTYDQISARLDGPLPNRQNIVLTSSPDSVESDVDTVHVVSSVDDALFAAHRLATRTTPEVEEVYVIGGASVYEQFLDTATRMILTEIHETYDGDAYFPDFDSDAWVTVSRDDRGEFAFITYERDET